MSWWESDRGWDQNCGQSWSGWAWWRHSDRPGDWWRDPDHPGDWWRDPDRPGDSAGQASSSDNKDWWRDPDRPETYAGLIADDDLTEARMAAAAEHGGPALPGAWVVLTPS